MYEETKGKLMDVIAESDDTREQYLMARAIADLTKAEAEIAEAEARRDAEAWKCESNEKIAKTEAKASIVRSALDNGTKVICGVIAAGVTKIGYDLITEHEVTGCVTSAIKGILPKLKFW